MSALTECGCDRCLDAQKRLDAERLYTRSEVEALLVAQRKACAEIPQHLACDDDHWQALHRNILATPLVEVKP